MISKMKLSPGIPVDRSAQRGVVLFISLVVLVIMTVSGIAMIRMMTSGLTIAGNLAFKRNATSGADLGVENGRNFVAGKSVALLSNVVAGQANYYPTWWGNAGTSTIFDPTTFDWSGVTPVDDGTGNTVRYVTHRLCPEVNKTDKCVVYQNKDGCDPSSPTYEACGKRYIQYRITAKVEGPRNTVSYTQVIIY